MLIVRDYNTIVHSIPEIEKSKDDKSKEKNVFQEKLLFKEHLD